MNPYEVLVPFNSPLNDFQKALIRNPYNESSLTRGIAYVRETDGLARSIISPSVAMSTAFGEPEIATAIDGVTSGMAGAVGFEVGIISAAAIVSEQVASVAVPIFMSAGFGGFLSGLLLFEGVIICTRIAQIRQSPAYQAWKARRIELMIDQAVNDFLKKDEILCLFLCPITGEIPLLPSKTRFDKTYDYNAAVRYIEQNPGKPLPGSPEPSTREELRFDYGHLNSICERIGNLQTLVRNDAHMIMQGRLNLVYHTGDAVCRNRWVAVMDIMVLRGHLTRSESFFGHQGLDFSEKVFRRCGSSFARGNMNRRAEFRREKELILSMPRVSASEAEIVLARHSELTIRANIVKKVYRVTLPNPDNDFVVFWKRLFNIGIREHYFYNTREGYDDFITCEGDNGWALDFPTIRNDTN